MNEAEKYLDFNLILKLGSKDNKVKVIQQSLKLNTSIYGEVQMLQRWLGTSTDGIFGKDTAFLLYKRLRKTQITLAEIPELWNITLRHGVRVKEVEELQKWLNVPVDGQFGNLTEARLKNKTGKKEIKLSELPYYAEKLIHENLSQIEIEDGK